MSVQRRCGQCGRWSPEFPWWWPCTLWLRLHSHKPAEQEPTCPSCAEGTLVASTDEHFQYWSCSTCGHMVTNGDQS